ncbi:MAG: hypothetical protein KIH69_021835 [Anaerolineae bacterium]|nr:hypothetical protein [Anaerolineae bacterium]
MPQIPPSIRQSRILALIVAVYFLAGSIYSVSSPLFEVSDELRHVALVEHYAQGNGFPVQDPKHLGFYEQEGSQPPLYYLSLAALAQLFDLRDFRQIAQLNPHEHSIGRADATDNHNMLLPSEADVFPWRGTALFVHLARLLGVALGCVTVICTYAIAQRLTSPIAHFRLVPVLAASFVAFNPMFVFISASVNNDTLATALASLALALAIHALHDGFTTRRAIGLGVMLGCAALTKASALVPVALIPLSLGLQHLWQLRQSRASKANFAAFLLKMALLGTLILLIAGWWYARNQLLYGDFSATRIQAEIDGLRDPAPTLLELVGEWNGFHQAYWGLFGAVNIPMHQPIYRLLELLLIVAGCGWLIAIHRVKQNKNLTIPNPTLFSWGLCWALMGLNFAALVRWTILTHASQGRLLFPSIAAISNLLALGLIYASGAGSALRTRHLNDIANRLAKIQFLRSLRRPRLPIPLVLLIPIALAMLTLAAPLLYIRPAYTPPPQISEAALPADLVRTEHHYADGMRWIGYRVDTDSSRVAAGEQFGVTLYWQTSRPITSNYSLFIKLYDRAENEVASLNTYPGGGLLPTSRWQTGNVIADHYRLRLNNGIATPTALRLDVGFYRFADPTRQPLPTLDSQGKPTGRQRYEVAGVGGVQDRAVSAKESAAGKAIGYFTLDSSWQRDAAVYVNVARAEQQGRQLHFRTHWAVHRDFAADYTIFAQLIDSAGNVVAQKDGRAMNEQFSAKWWREGDFVMDERTLDLPATLPAGSYTLLLGLYRPSDFARLPALQPNGQPAQDNALRFEVKILPF